jgi:hypothetical protein
MIQVCGVSELAVFGNTFRRSASNDVCGDRKMVIFRRMVRNCELLFICIFPRSRFSQAEARQMFEELTENGVIPLSDALDALSELEQNTSQAITAMRASQRIDIRTRVWIQPGNSSSRTGFVIEGLTADISRGGCMLLIPRPLMVGDIFWLRISDEHLRIAPMLVRCVRCRLVREDAFEVGIRFLNEIDLTDSIASSALGGV